MKLTSILAVWWLGCAWTAAAAAVAAAVTAAVH